MESKAVWQAINVAGGVAAILFLVIHFYQHTIGKLKAPSAKDSSRLMSLMVWLVAMLALVCIAAYVFLQRAPADVAVNASQHRASTAMSEMPLPVVIEKNVVVQATVPSEVMDRVEKLAATVEQQSQGLTKERNVSASTDAELALYQIEHLRQNFAGAWAVLFDLARLRNFSVSESQLQERWQVHVANPADLAQQLEVLARYKLILRNGNIALSARASTALLSAGLMPEAIGTQQVGLEWCPRASRPVDVAICASSTLISYETRLMQLFQQDRARRGDLAVQDQTTWRTGERDRCGAAEECLQTAYQQRIVNLEQRW